MDPSNQDEILERLDRIEWMIRELVKAELNCEILATKTSNRCVNVNLGGSTQK